MYCPKCGSENDANAAMCSNCGAPLQQTASPQVSAQPGASVPNYLVQAILVTIFCCLPFGIVAIVYAAQVNGKLAAGDYAGAVETSGKAKMWSWVSFGIGLAGVIVYVLLMVLGTIAGMSQ